MFSNYYNKRRVLVTGHTGFKGSWLCEWLLCVNAEVAGYALDPQPHEVLYDQLQLGSRISQDYRGDISNLTKIYEVISSYKPDVIFHLAAQPLVRLSYEQPVETFATNVMGTVNLLEAVRLVNHPCTVVCVTTDKCYENKEWIHAYREEDPMGGHDPYSASKGSAELVIASYRRSFFGQETGDRKQGSGIKIASARAGNVIGGGDWADDRIVPDCIRSIRKQQPIAVRNKVATRPWQHVLEPLSGYLHLAATMAQTTKQEATLLASAFNFGPNLTSNRTVAELVQALIAHTGGEWQDASDPKSLHEATKLNLAVDKAFHLLKWRPVWSFEETVSHTAAWYLGESTNSSPSTRTLQQIEAYHQAASQLGLSWA